jgi:hypothetical protein
MQYGKTGSAADSDKFAQENIAQKWGTSDANNSRVMAYPPERYYPQVGGSTDYVRTQLNDFVRNRAGAQGVELPAPAQAFMPGLGLVQTSPVAETAEQQRALNIASGAHALVPDAQTQAEIANRQLPGYQVVVSDTSGQFHLLMDGDRPARFHGDPTQPQATAEQRFTTAHDRAARAGEAIRGMESMVPWGQP